MKKILTTLSLIALFMCFFFTPFSVKADSKYPTYTVLVLDTSGTHKFTSGGSTIYTAESAITQVKEAATNFTNAVLKSDSNHKIAIITYKGSATVVSNFTNDSSTLTNAISNISASGESASISAALEKADSLLSAITNPSVAKNVVLFTTGFTNTGSYNYSGKYNDTTPGHTWYNTSTKKHLYAYANVALEKAQVIHKYANLYTIGLFENWAGMPEKGQELVTFFKQFTQDLANPLENFNPVYNKNDLDAAFAAACNGVINNPFKDVNYQLYYFDAVIWAGENGITQGTEFDTFDPNSICTREQMVTFLWRAEGCPTPESDTMPFVDVEAGRFSYDAVLWAAENHITLGTSDTTFSPTDTVTREQVVTLLWRTAGAPEDSLTNTFIDVFPEDYSYNAILWAQKEGITNGVTATKFCPKDPCTRGQIITFLYRYYTEE